MRIVLLTRKVPVCVSLVVQYSLILSVTALPFYRPTSVRAQNKIPPVSALSFALLVQHRIWNVQCQLHRCRGLAVMAMDQRAVST